MTNRIDTSDWELAVCGLNCAKCHIHQAYKNEDRKGQWRISTAIFGDDIDIKPGAIACDTCRGSLETHWSPNCRLRTCAEAKGPAYCFQCAAFVCDHLRDFSGDGPEHHRRTVDNLTHMKAIDVAAWLQKQYEKGPAVFCP
jgi:hypothetical protein